MIHTATTVLSFLTVPHEDAKALAFFLSKARNLGQVYNVQQV